MKPRTAAAVAAIASVVAIIAVCDAGTVKEDVVASAVYIQGDGYVGSGVCVKHDGEVLVLTANHVLEDCYKPRTRTVKDKDGKEHDIVDVEPSLLQLKWKSGKSCDGKPVYYDPTYRAGGIDIGLVKPVDVEGIHCTELLDGDVEDGEELWYCGSGGGIPFNLDKSILNQQDEKYLMVNGDIWYGHSGCGVWFRCKDGKHRLGGIIVLAAADPARYPKTPGLAERKIRKVLADYDKVKNKGK